MDDTALKAKFVLLVNRYFTPFAIVLVGTGLLFTQPEKNTVIWALILMIFPVFFNIISAWLVKSKITLVQKIAGLRLESNYIINILLVYLLGKIWMPIWLLFLLTPIATALYKDRKQTFKTSIFMGASLIAIYGVHNLRQPLSTVEWGAILIYSALIVFLSLFINSLMKILQEKP